MEKEIINMRVVPFVRDEKIVKNGKTSFTKVDNLSSEEIRKMSVVPQIFEKSSDGEYVLDKTMIRFKGTGLRMLLCYVYSDLTLEEQQKYLDRSIVLPVTVKSETKTTTHVKKMVRK